MKLSEIQSVTKGKYVKADHLKVFLSMIYSESEILVERNREIDELLGVHKLIRKSCFDEKAREANELVIQELTNELNTNIDFLLLYTEIEEDLIIKK